MKITVTINSRCFEKNIRTDLCEVSGTSVGGICDTDFVNFDTNGHQEMLFSCSVILLSCLKANENNEPMRNKFNPRHLRNPWINFNRFPNPSLPIPNCLF
jgi:hypothetical protein